MTIVYRTSGPWGAGKGANLVPAEVDGNFFDVSTRVTVLEDNAPAASNGIAYFNIGGTNNELFYVHMTDGTIQGPFALPQKTWNFRGAWAPSVVYNVDDVVTMVGGVYLVLFNHTSASTFDPNANDGLGHNYYGLLLSNPTNVLPAGGLQGEYLVKTSDADYAVGWRTPIVFPAQNLLEAPNPTYTLTISNISSYVRCVNASGCAITIPSDATLNFALSTEMSFRQCTDAGVVLSPDTGVVFNLISGLQSKTARNGAVITAKKIAANSWDIFGLLSS
jgi:hypothetical protein